MRPIFCEALAALLALTAAAPLQRQPAPATSHDFGRVRQGETVTHAFRVAPPASTTPVRVLRVDLTGPGMTARFKPDVPAGQPATIRIAWDTSRVEGSVEAQAIVRWADPRQPPTTLTIRGVVVPSIELQPMGAVFFSVFTDERAEQVVQIVNHREAPLRILRLEPAGSLFSATIKELQPGRRFELRVIVAPGQAPGRSREHVAVHTDAPDRPVIQVPVNVLVKADVYANPEAIDFGDIEAAALRRNAGLITLTTQTILVRRRQGPFEITASRTDLPALEVRISPGSEAVHRVEVSLSPARLSPGALTGTITLTTSDPRHPTIAIPVRGRVR